MSSWQLLIHLIWFSEMSDNPIFLREANRAPLWQKILRRLSHATGLMLVLGGLGCYLSVLLVFFLNNLLILVAPFLFLWTMLVGMTLGPVVVGERERRTWEILRATPFNTETILLGKACGALWWLRDIIRLMTGFLVMVAAGVGLVSLVLTPTLSDRTLGDLPEIAVCGLAMVVPFFSAGIFIVDRAQQFVLTAVMSLAASAPSKSIQSALVGGGGVALVVWLLDVGVAIGVLALEPGQLVTESPTDLLVMAIMGPMIGYLNVVSFARMMIYMALTLLGRELVVRLLWRWTVRTASGVV